MCHYVQICFLFIEIYADFLLNCRDCIHRELELIFDSTFGLNTVESSSFNPNNQLNFVNIDLILRLAETFSVYLTQIFGIVIIQCLK